MKIKTLRLSLILLTLTIVFVSCNGDDDNGSTFVAADRTEQQVIDDAVILQYLSSHYYNSSFFETGSDFKYTDIIISELPINLNGEYEAMPDPTNNTLLFDAVETRTATYYDVEYKYYVLSLNQGEGDTPKFTDFVRARYEGSSINEEVGGEEVVFDSAITAEDFYLQTDFVSIVSVIKAWQLVMPTFSAAESFGIDGNGSVNYTNPGLGMMFVPSGLGYFSGVTTGASYDNLIFKFELLQTDTVDHDDDGIPSYIEDLNENLDIEDDDTDEDGFFNFIDNNDDGDNVFTIDELITTVYPPVASEDDLTLAENEFIRSRVVNTDGSITFKTVTIADSNNDGVPDYLDASIEINYNEL
ncbi:FKBP-type peptidyl-prolyl cis-trans isomerase [Winogradskyella sp. Asnod2-B02-A]|uniref:FKBP-type peptidyl-prolyl cis-trans isomerase n=1 Tax=Winogradskyella sp. Asnod2-B02-A TaxID=3160583 RepID=UPI003865B431